MALAAFSVVVGACAFMGCQPRSALRATSPDGQLVAVCREIPVLDGPDYELRLERRDGSEPRIRIVFHPIRLKSDIKQMIRTQRSCAWL